MALITSIEQLQAGSGSSRNHASPVRHQAVSTIPICQGADRVAGDDNFHPPVLFAARGGGVRYQRTRVAQTAHRGAAGRQSVPIQHLAHALRPLPGLRFGGGAVRVSLYYNAQFGILLENRRHPPDPARNRFLQFRSAKAGIRSESTRLNSSHLVISYAVFCLKKKKTK